MQKKRRINSLLVQLLCSGVSLRRSARILSVHPITVSRRLVFLGIQARRKHAKYLGGKIFEEIQFDEMKTSEHTKCKPLSIALAVDKLGRKILALEISQIPADGHLAAFARKKYGFRRNDRERGLGRLFQKLVPLTTISPKIMSDEWGTYPGHVRRTFPAAQYTQVKGRRGCIAGQGELKKIGFDPLFSLNHTCAMIRANVNRLFRRTWCTTKKRERLMDHLMIYTVYHNEVLTA